MSQNQIIERFYGGESLSEISLVYGLTAVEDALRAERAAWLETHQHQRETIAEMRRRLLDRDAVDAVMVADMRDCVSVTMRDEENVP
jgi:hypothetical protein